MQLRWNDNFTVIELIEQKGGAVEPIILKKYGAARLDPLGEASSDISTMLLEAPFKVTKEVFRKMGYALITDNET